MSNREELVVNKIIGQDAVELVFAKSSRTSLTKTSADTATLVAAAGIDRRVIIMVTVDETFAAGGGAATIVSVGQTGTATKFINALAAGTAGDKVMYDGVLTANTALISTATAATGAGTGGVTMTAMVV